MSAAESEIREREPLPEDLKPRPVCHLLRSRLALRIRAAGSVIRSYGSGIGSERESEALILWRDAGDYVRLMDKPMDPIKEQLIRAEILRCLRQIWRLIRADFVAAGEFVLISRGRA